MGGEEQKAVGSSCSHRLCVSRCPPGVHGRCVQHARSRSELDPVTGGEHKLITHSLQVLPAGRQGDVGRSRETWGAREQKLDLRDFFASREAAECDRTKKLQA